jgi:hypothetical protein
LPGIPALAGVRDDLAFEQAPLMLRTASRNPDRIAHDTDAAGADSPVNIAWDKTRQGSWYIEEQRYGADAVVAGIVKDNPGAIERGLRILKWGFLQQGPDGSFACPDSFHSTSFFVEASAHACLMLGASAYRERYQRDVDWMRPRVLKAARWMCRPDVEGPGRAHNKPYTHRRYLVGAALGEAGVLTGDASLVRKSWEYVSEGIRLQSPEGFNPEKGGFDSSYHAVGLTFAGRYYEIVADGQQRGQIRAMLERADAWLATRVGPDGSVDPEGNTRTGLGQEVGRNRTLKGINFGCIERAFLRWSILSGDPSYEALAERVAAFGEGPRRP